VTVSPDFFNRTLEVWRIVSTDDGMGGTTTDLVQQDDIDAKVDQPSAVEMQTAAQWESEHSHNVYAAPSADVRRGDELRGVEPTTGKAQKFRVLSTVAPSTAIYLKARCELDQAEGT
jgi:hypothetical protein